MASLPEGQTAAARKPWQGLARSADRVAARAAFGAAAGAVRPSRASSAGDKETAARLRKQNQRRERNKAFVDRGGAKAGTLVEGTVLATTPAGVIVSLGEGAATGVIGKKEMSAEQVESTVGLLAPGTKVRALVLPRTRMHPNQYDIFLSTKALEPSPGDMLRDPQLVYDRAEEMAEARCAHLEKRNEENREKERRYRAFIHDCEFQGRKLHEGVVVDVRPHGVLVELTESGATAMLGKQEISHGSVLAAGDVFKVGDKVRACLLGSDHKRLRIWITTKPLETMPGDMLRDPGRVYEQAGAVFEAWLEKAPKQEDVVEGVVSGVNDEGDIAITTEGGYRGTVKGHTVGSWGWRDEEEEQVKADEAGGTDTAIADYVARLAQPEPYVKRLKEVARVGDKIKTIVYPRIRVVNPLALPLSIHLLEVTSGDFLRDPQLVYATAEDMAAKRRVEWQQSREERAEKERAAEAARERVEQARFAAISAMKGRIHDDSLLYNDPRLSTSRRLVLVLRGQPKKTRGVIELSEISHEAVEDWKGLCESLSKTKIRALVLKPDPDDPCRVLLSTKALEPTPGDMLRDPQLVYDRAEEMAAAWRAKRWAAQAVGTQQAGS